jgi:hypothetical protein
MIVGFGIGIGRNRFGTSGVTPFATDQWQLLTVTFWNNITDTWN